jgi:CheY-like chemotaxis protein
LFATVTHARRQATPVTPIFLITADVSDCFEDILKLGVPYLTKPLLLNQLLAQVHKLEDDGKPNSEVRREH